jgi:F-type H+-transporting ATPase subunit epsilon
MIFIEVILPTEIMLKGEYDHIIVPGIDGDFGVDQDHTAFITKIRPGILNLYKGDAIEKYVMHDGFVTVDDNKITIVCEVIEKEHVVDFSRADESKIRAEKRIKTNSEDTDVRRAEASLKRALARLSLQKKEG